MLQFNLPQLPFTAFLSIITPLVLALTGDIVFLPFKCQARLCPVDAEY